MYKKIVVIGGGVAGLSSGIYAQMNGYDTEIVEMHTVAGGQCTAWTRKGYRFDYCLHWLVGTARGDLNSIWKETNVLNGETNIIDHEIHTRMVNDKGEDFIIYSDIDQWENYLIKIAPEDERSIRKMCKSMRKGGSFEPTDSGSGFKGKIKKYLSYLKIIPLLPIFIKYGRKNCNDYFKELNFKNPRLTYFLNETYGSRNFSAVAFIMMLGWFHKKNAGYITGGSLPMAKRMTDRFLDLGGKLALGKRVDKIIVENNTAKGVVLSDGRVISADYVIGAADGYNTIFNMLGGTYVSDEIRKAYETWDLFTPFVQVSFGLKTVIPAEYPLQNFIGDQKMIGSTELKYGFSLMNYAYDFTMAPEGKSVMVMRFESPWEFWNDLKSEEYKAEKKQIETDATAVLESIYPELAGKIEVVDVATPITNVRYTGVWKGSYEGFSPSASNITKHLGNTLPGLDNFYMAGQWLFPGGGLPPSVLSGKTAIRKICKNDNKSFKVAAE